MNKNENSPLLDIRRCFKVKISGWPMELRKPASFAFEKTISGNADKQMYLSPYLICQALGKEISKGLLAELGMMNIFFWSAFIIYDDFWDRDERADPLLLPVANIFAREHARFFSFMPEFEQLMRKVDAANAWEISECRMRMDGGKIIVPKKLPTFGDYTKKYEPASGHVLVPMYIFRFLGMENADRMVSFFKHLLISMQLSDDMRDFREDLRRGHISTSADLLFSDLDEKTIDLGNLVHVKEIFVRKTVPKIAKRILCHTKMAKEELLGWKMIKNPSPLLHLAEIYEDIGKEALRKYLSFLH